MENTLKYVVSLCLFFTNCIDDVTLTPSHDWHSAYIARNCQSSSIHDTYRSGTHAHDRSQRSIGFVRFLDFLEQYYTREVREIASARDTHPSGQIYDLDRYSITRNQVYGLGIYDSINNWQGPNHHEYHNTTTYAQSNPKCSPIRQNNMPEEDCAICTEEYAFKKHGAFRCLKCKGYICYLCYKNILETSNSPTEYDYNTPMSTHTYKLEAKCPFCKTSF